MRRARALLMIVVLATTASSCVYYNTFYLARKYYGRGTAGEPYTVDKAQGGQVQEFARSIDYSKKVLSQYPKSKWVDDAYLLWARALLGQDDPLQTVKMLESFDGRFPKSSQSNEARFYLGVAYRQARKYRIAVRTFDEFLEKAPKHELAPYAYLERARALVALKEPVEAAASASQVIERFSGSNLVDRARIARADASFDAKQFDAARADYQELGRRSFSDEDRLRYLLSEADCLEAAQQYEPALTLLRDALSYERAPLPPDTTGGRPAVVQAIPGYDRYGRLLTRMGTVHLRAGHLEEALSAYQRVVSDYPRDPVAAEAQYRIGYAYETLGDDFERARQEYQRVKDQSGQVGFGLQAIERLRTLDRIAQFRGAGADSADQQIEAAFLVAEQYLFSVDKPERALEEYQKIAEQYAGKPPAAKAINAQAWVLSRRLKRPAEADSLFWNVVHNFPATQAQLAARDYLEMSGKSVPAELITLPEPQYAALDTAIMLTQPPDSLPALGEQPFDLARVDSLGMLPPREPIPMPRESRRPYVPADSGPGFAGDTPGHAAPGSTVRGPEPPRTDARKTTPTPSAPEDSVRREVPLPVRPVPRDTTGGNE